MKKSARFDKSLDSHLNWRPVGANKLVSDRQHVIIFILGPAHRDAALKSLRKLKREQKSAATRCTRKEKSYLAADL